MPGRIKPGHGGSANKPDVHRMALANRQKLITDTPLSIIVGDLYVCALPIELFRAMSKRDGKIDMNHPNGPALFLPDVETWPILEIVAWIRQLVEKVDYAHLTVMRDNNDELCTFRDLSLIRAGKLLGMQLYVNEMYKVYAKQIDRGMFCFEDVDAVVKLSLEKNDTFLKRLGGTLGKMIRDGHAAKVFPWLDGYLEDHSWLKHWVDKELKEEFAREKEGKKREDAKKGQPSESQRDDEDVHAGVKKYEDDAKDAAKNLK